MTTKAIAVDGLSKRYSEQILVLDNLSYHFLKNKFYAITGSSGAGKTTLLQILGTINNADSGVLEINGQSVCGLGDKQKSHIRRDEIGFVFQDFMLNPHLRAYENVMLPMLIRPGISHTQMKSKAIDILAKLGLEPRVEHFPHQLSGGEQQRVAIARALANDPCIILADEPTGNLDADNEEVIFSLLKSIAQENRCVITVSHNEHINTYADIVLRLEHGCLAESAGGNHE